MTFSIASVVHLAAVAVAMVLFALFARAVHEGTRPLTREEEAILPWYFVLACRIQRYVQIGAAVLALTLFAIAFVWPYLFGWPVTAAGPAAG